MVYFVGEFLKTWSFRSNSVTRQVSFNRTKNGGKCQNSKCDIFSNFQILWRDRIMHSYFVFLLCLHFVWSLYSLVFRLIRHLWSLHFFVLLPSKRRKDRKLSSCYKFCDRASSGRKPARQNILLFQRVWKILKNVSFYIISSVTFFVIIWGSRGALIRIGRWVRGVKLKRRLFGVILKHCVYSFLAAFLFRKVAKTFRIGELLIEAKRKRFVEPLSRFSAALASPSVCISNPIAHQIRTPLFFFVLAISCIFPSFGAVEKKKPQIDAVDALLLLSRKLELHCVMLS